MKKEEYLVDEKDWKNNFADMMRKLLEAKEVSVNRVATDIGVDPKTLRNYIAQESVPSAIIIKKLADYFQVSTDYLISYGKCDTGYSDNTILELASVVKNFDVTLGKNREDEDKITLNINDRVLSMILKELYFSKGRSDFDSIAEKLAKSYGKMKVYQKHLVDYTTFQNLIRHEYVFHDLEEDMMLCTDENGNDCFGTDPYTFEEIERRSEEWENMSCLEKEQWWEEYSKEGMCDT